MVCKLRQEIQSMKILNDSYFLILSKTFLPKQNLNKKNKRKKKKNKTVISWI